MPKLGIIGGSGVYDIDGVTNKKWVKIDTPFGDPSDEFLLAKFNHMDVVFLPRHARGHKISPSEINYRANIYGMKSLGVEKIVSITACGSLKEDLKPLDFVVPNQFIDRTRHRKDTFFDQGVVAHVSFAEPVCSELASIVYSCAKDCQANVHKGGTYINMEGPQFSTLAESNLYRSWGVDIIGMTNLTEARLAREAEICFATLAAITDYDCWHPEAASVTIEVILDNLNKNVEVSKKIISKVLSVITDERECGCKDALKFAIVTDPKVIPQATKNNLNIIARKYIK